MQDVRSRESCQCRQGSGRFADYVRLRGGPKRLILIDQEQELLKIAITEFGMSLADANSVLYAAATEQGAVLESQIEQHILTYLGEAHTAREARLIDMGRLHTEQEITRARFERAVNLYQTLTRAALSRQEARKRLKHIVQRLGLKPQRDWRSLGSRKWFNVIDQSDPQD